MPVRSDTTPAATRVQREIVGRMSGPERMLAAMRMSEEAAAATKDGIRHRNPTWSEEQVHGEFLRLTLGPDLAAKVLAADRIGS